MMRNGIDDVIEIQSYDVIIFCLRLGGSAAWLCQGQIKEEETKDDCQNDQKHFAFLCFCLLYERDFAYRKHQKSIIILVLIVDSLDWQILHTLSYGNKLLDYLCYNVLSAFEFLLFPSLAFACCLFTNIFLILRSTLSIIVVFVLTLLAEDIYEWILGMLLTDLLDALLKFRCFQAHGAGYPSSYIGCLASRGSCELITIQTGTKSQLFLMSRDNSDCMYSFFMPYQFM